MVNKKRNIVILFSLIMFIGVSKPMYGTTPTEILTAVENKFKSAGGVECHFTVTAGGKKMNGEYRASGNKFSVLSPQGSTWYNGTAMYTYNPSTAETTISSPTASELAENNPLYYLTSASRAFTPVMAATQPKGGYSLDLTPRTRKATVKKVNITVTSGYVPQQVIITGSNGTVTTVDIRNISYNARHASSAFEYPKTRYSKAQIVDLR